MRCVHFRPQMRWRPSLVRVSEVHLFLLLRRTRMPSTVSPPRADLLLSVRRCRRNQSGFVSAGTDLISAECFCPAAHQVVGEANLCPKPLAFAQPATAPLETAGFGARPVGPGVAMTTGASSSRKASAMWGATLNAHRPMGRCPRDLLGLGCRAPA